MLFSLGGPMTKEILYRFLQHRRPVLHDVFKRDNVCSSILKCFLFLFALFVVCWREITFPLTGYWDSVWYVWGRHFLNKCYIKFLMVERVFRVFQHFYYKMNLFQRDKNYVCQFSSSYPKLCSRQSFPQVFQFLLWDPERDPWDIQLISWYWCTLWSPQSLAFHAQKTWAGVQKAFGLDGRTTSTGWILALF